MEIKNFNLHVKAKSDEGNGSFTGVGNVTGILDRANEVVAKGAFGDLSALIRDGFISDNHKWDELAPAMIKNAFEDEEGLQIEALFHSTPEGQRARTYVQERLTAGKTVGLSIGYTVLSSREFSTVDEMETYCRDAKVHFDRTSAKGYNGYCRLLEKVDTFEVALATVPCNTASLVRGSKRFSGGTCSLPDHSKGLLAESSDYVTRLTDLHEKRDGAFTGRALEDLRAVKDALRKDADALEALEPREEEPAQAAETDAPTKENPSPAEVKALLASFGL